MSIIKAAHAIHQVRAELEAQIDGGEECRSRDGWFSMQIDRLNMALAQLGLHLSPEQKKELSS